MSLTCLPAAPISPNDLRPALWEMVTLFLFKCFANSVIENFLPRSFLIFVREFCETMLRLLPLHETFNFLTDVVLDLWMQKYVLMMAKLYTYMYLLFSHFGHFFK